MARVFLIDTMFHIHRAYHALPPILSPSGQPTQAVRGVVGILANLWKSERIRHLACVFETRGSSFRQQIDPDYKAHRPSAPAELLSQVPLVEQTCRALGLPTYQQPGHEADDLLATLAVQAAAAGHDVVVVSNDKDLAQLCVDPKICLLRIKGQGKNQSLEYIDRERVPQLFGVGPELIASWLALNGDAVDNIPGVPGIGPKTACKLLLELGPLPELLEQCHRAGRHQKVLEEQRERLLLNYQLAQLKTDLPLRFSLEGVTPGPFLGLVELYRELGMKRNLEPFEGSLFEPANVLELWS